MLDQLGAEIAQSGLDRHVHPHPATTELILLARYFVKAWVRKNVSATLPTTTVSRVSFPSTALTLTILPSVFYAAYFEILVF